MKFRDYLFPRFQISEVNEEKLLFDQLYTLSFEKSKYKNKKNNYIQQKYELYPFLFKDLYGQYIQEIEYGRNIIKVILDQFRLL